MENAPVTPAAASNVAQVLSEQQMSEAQICGSRFARNKMDRILIAQDMAASMGTEPTFDQWEQHRRWFLDGYTSENPATHRQPQTALGPSSPLCLMACSA